MMILLSHDDVRPGICPVLTTMVRRIGWEKVGVDWQRKVFHAGEPESIIDVIFYSTEYWNVVGDCVK
jgi:hypothetical protein